MKVIVEHISTNPHCRVFHFGIPLTGHYIWSRSSGYTLDQSAGHPTLDLVQQVEGVESILLSSAYSVMISKGRVFEWEEIEPLITSIFEGHNSLAALGMETK